MRDGMKNGKPGSKSVGTGAGSNPANGSGGNAGRSLPQKAIPGPASPGQPIAMRKALAKKSRPDKGTSFPGLVR